MLNKVKVWFQSNPGWISTIGGLITIIGAFSGMIYAIATFNSEYKSFTGTTQTELTNIRTDIKAIDDKVDKIDKDMPERLRDRFTEVCIKCKVK